MIRVAERPVAAIIASALLLTSALGYLVADRVRLLATGREIVLPIIPVDPRDLFKGDYARLGFPISRLDPAIRPEPAPDPRRPASPRTIYVTLQQQPDESWKAVAASFERPAVPASGREVILRGRTRPWSALDVTYGVERYFVPEGSGRRIEKLARERKLAAVIAVDSNGIAAIKGLVVDGQRIYEEPLF